MEKCYVNCEWKVQRAICTCECKSFMTFSWIYVICDIKHHLPSPLELLDKKIYIKLFEIKWGSNIQLFYCNCLSGSYYRTCDEKRNLRI